MVRLRYLFPFLFALSGASGLIFEIVWQRYMVLAFGASAPAITAILTAFFTGIALGSWWGGKLLRTTRNLLRAYAFLELWIGLWGIAVPLLLKVADQLQIPLYEWLEPGPWMGFSLRFLLAMATVLPATLGMGATIPAMNRIVHGYKEEVGRSVSLAFGMNTAGAVLGCLLAGLLFIPELGLQRSLYAAGSLNVIVFLSVLLLAAFRNRTVDSPQNVGTGQPILQIAKEFGRSRVGVILSLYGLAGFLALGYEIVWFRMLGIYNSNSVITFTIGLAVYLLGFATGSLALFPLLAKRMQLRSVFALSLFGAGVASMLLVAAAYRFPDLNRQILHNLESVRTYHIIRQEILTAGILMFLPTCFMGLAYPAVCGLLVSSPAQTAPVTGLVYFVGTLGSAAGAISVSLGIVPAFDLTGSLAFLTIASAVLTVLAITATTPRHQLKSRTSVVGAGVLALTAAAFALFGHPFVEDGHLQRNGDNWAYRDSTPTFEKRLLRYRTGASGTVSVLEIVRSTDQARFLRVDNHAVAASDPGGLIDTKLLAHIPLVIHPNPKTAATVGFGSGSTSWSMSRYGVEVDAIEIEPEVINSAEFFTAQNHNVIQHPHFNLILDDARHHFHVTDRRYDVISTDVTNLQYKQNSSLYTREYFDLLKRRLRKGGIACAWAPMASVTDREFRILLATFQEVFPHTSVWIPTPTATSYYALFIGTPGPLKIDFQRLQGIFSDDAIREDLAEIGFLNFGQILRTLMLDAEGARQYAGEVPLHTDDRPILEFHTVASSWGAQVNLDTVLSYSVPAFNEYLINFTQRDFQETFSP